MTEDDLKKLGYIEHRGQYYHPDDERLRPPKPKPAPAKALAGCPPAQDAGASRRLVRITVHRPRLHDPDNITVKAIIDALRSHKIIPDDRPEDVAVEITQVKCRTKKQQKTVVEIMPCPPSAPDVRRH